MSCCGIWWRLGPTIPKSAKSQGNLCANFLRNNIFRVSHLPFLERNQQLLINLHQYYYTLCSFTVNLFHMDSMLGWKGLAPLASRAICEAMAVFYGQLSLPSVPKETRIYSVCLWMTSIYFQCDWDQWKVKPKWQPNSIETGWQWMNTRNGYCQMKKTVPRPNADCAKGVSPFPTWEQEPWKVMHRGKSTKVRCFMWLKELLPSRTIWRSQKKQKPQH